MSKVSRRKGKKRLSASEKALARVRRTHARYVRSVFRNAGFERFSKLSEKEFSLDESVTSDFDDVYVFENIVVCAEYTVSKSENVPEHLRKKRIVYDYVCNSPETLLEVLGQLDSSFCSKISEKYNMNEVIVRCLYCSRNDFEQKHKSVISNVIYLDYPELRYFKSLTDSIKHSARPELIDFLGICLAELGHDGKIHEPSSSRRFSATVLPEANSNFARGFKVVTFYVDPQSLLDRAYVLRRQGWKDSDGLYQRMISRAKIDAIRRHLKSEKRVFVNNIIATLADDTKILDDKGNTVDPSTIRRTQSVELLVPNRLNTVGLIDGQHRTYSYYASHPDDADIARLRKKLNLLVTGIIYPEGMSTKDRETFEARLFLEINSNQLNARSDLKQAINRIVDSFSDESIAAAVVERLGKTSGPLNGQIVRHWFDTDKLKTTSVVSYGMKALVKTSGNDSLFRLWADPEKTALLGKTDTRLLDRYIRFCRSEINKYLVGVKGNLPAELWTPDRKVNGRLITTTAINGLLICLRLLIENEMTGDAAYYEEKLAELSPSDFYGFHSSQYGKLAESLFEKHFS